MSTARECARCARVRKIEARGLCGSCYTTAWREGELIDYPRRSLTRDEFIEEFDLLSGQGFNRTQIAERLGMTRNTLDQRLVRLGSPYSERRVS